MNTENIIAKLDEIKDMLTTPRRCLPVSDVAYVEFAKATLDILRQYKQNTFPRPDMGSMVRSGYNTSWSPEQKQWWDLYQDVV